MLLRCFCVSALVVSPEAAVSVTFASLRGAPDPGLARGETLIASFDRPHAAGVTDTSRGAVITATGSIGGVRAAPAGIGNSVYRSIGTGSSSVFDFTGWTRGRGLESFSVYWGSVDSYNFIDFLDIGGRQVATMAGNALPLANGDQVLAATNRRVFFDFRPEQKVTAVRFRSDGAAFEFDNLGASAVVPEPENWALLIIGFGLVGVLARRRQKRVVVAE